jgi:hypothetical protein
MHSSRLVRMQMSGDALMKCVSIERRGFLGDAAEQNAALPPGRIIPNLERDRAGSRCTACTHHFRAKGTVFSCASLYRSCISQLMPRCSGQTKKKCDRTLFVIGAFMTEGENWRMATMLQLLLPQALICPLFFFYDINCRFGPNFLKWLQVHSGLSDPIKLATLLSHLPLIYMPSTPLACLHA